MPAGRPKSDEEMDYLRVRVPKKYLTIAEGHSIKYKQTIREVFEKMVCTMILTERGEDPCEICENVVRRNQMIDAELKAVMSEIAQKQSTLQAEQEKMIAAIKLAVTEGKHRGEAESEYGHTFPDTLWEKYGVKA